MKGSVGQYSSKNLFNFLAGLPTLSRPNILRWFRNNLEIETKEDLSPVTAVDFNVEAILRSEIKKQFPADNITGEEFKGDTQTSSPYCWVIDPIDGTKAFVSGKPVFGTLVGLVFNGDPIAGLVDFPALDETYIGLNGFSGVQKAMLGRVPVAPSKCLRLKNARLATTSPRVLSSECLQGFNRLADRVAITNYGGDCHNYALIASGHLDIVMEDRLAPHDIAAVAGLMLAAGVTVTDLEGVPIVIGYSTGILAAATPSLHADALKLISN